MHPRMRGLVHTFAALTLFGALSFLGACGGDDSVQGPPPPPPPPPPVALDFGAVAGSWSGWGLAGGFDLWLVIELGSSAQAGQMVGTSAVGVATSDGDLVETCAGDLFALTAEPPEYTVDTRYTDQPANCVGGLLELEHDAAAGTLRADFTAEDDSFTGTHVLRPGSDPGPPP